MIKFIGDAPVKAFILDNAPIASSFNVLVRRKGKFITRKADDSVLTGIENVKLALQSGKVKVNDCCKQLIKEAGMYMWNEKSVHDEPLKINDDNWSCARYFINTILGRRTDFVTLRG